MALISVAAVFALSACATAPVPTLSIDATPLPSEPAPRATTAASEPRPTATSFARRELVVWRPNEFSPMTAGPLAYLSTDPLLPSCAVARHESPNPADSAGNACAWPLRELSPDGLFIQLWSTRLLQPLPIAGAEIELNGALAYIQVARPGCSEIGADEQLTVGVPLDPGALPGDMSNRVIIGCLRGPHLAELEQQFRDALADWPVLR